MKSALHRGPLCWGDGDPHIERLRAAYRAQEPLSYGLSERQEDLLRMLVAAGEPLRAKELYWAFDGIERTWVDHSPQGIRTSLGKLIDKGLVERAGRERRDSYKTKLYRPSSSVIRRVKGGRIRRVAV